jgi:hypothetical protein
MISFLVVTGSVSVPFTCSINWSFITARGLNASGFFCPVIHLYINVIYVTCLCDEYIVTVNKMNFEIFNSR